MNKLTIIGNLTKDPESRTLDSGKTVCSFTVAVNRRQKDKDGNNIADFFRVDAWEKTGEACQKYLAKGRKVAVTGPVSCRAYQAQDGTARASMDLHADEVEFLSPRDSGQTAPAAQTGGMTPVEVPDGELPF